MGHSDKEVLTKARELVATGLDQRRVIINTLQAEGPNLDQGRRKYLWSFLVRRLRGDARRKTKKEAKLLAQAIPLPPAPTPLSYKVRDDGRFVFVSVCCFVYQFKPTTRDMLLREFRSGTREKTLANTSGDIHHQAKIEALTYFRSLTAKQQSQLVHSR